ncbi:MAG: hypothetical protein MRERC_3c046 [Mycoplasmataceae bacterium RC_NB112A]|nr:MAG: hypothetical protein MRERC_3c046 [Mycoplasmataceae bacterium RC_NB112A]
MRTNQVDPKHTFSIYLPTSLYQKLLNKAGKGKISTFVREVLEEKLIREEQNQKEQLRKRLITAYKRMRKNKNFQRSLSILEEASIKDMSKKFESK